MTQRVTTLITTVNSWKSKGIQALVSWSDQIQCPLIIIADQKTPPYPSDLAPRIVYVSLQEQYKMFTKLARALPVNHYSRKNIGYVLTHKMGYASLFETDDDNLPTEDIFLREFSEFQIAMEATGWINVYRHFGQDNLWPRGIPLNTVYKKLDKLTLVRFEKKRSVLELLSSSGSPSLDVGVFQSLVDGDPDLDAIGRMLFPEKHFFKDATPPILLGQSQICPTNSQATLWRSDLLPLLYLPITSSFRMTDIWRGIIVQEFMSSQGLKTAFGKLSTYQDRNRHDVIEDLRSEFPGHIYSDEIREIAKRYWKKYSVDGTSGVKNTFYSIYENLVSLKILHSTELKALEAYLEQFD